MKIKDQSKVIKVLKSHLMECMQEDCEVYHFLTLIKAPEGSSFMTMAGHLYGEASIEYTKVLQEGGD